MRTSLFAVLGIACGLTLVACSDSHQAVEASGAAPMRTEMMMAQPAAAPTAPRPDQQLAYEHFITVELSRELLPRRMREVQDACASNKELACTLLDVSLHSNESLPSGTIRVRVAPPAVETLIAMATKDGELTARNTHAEDLAEPVADTDRQLALLTTHRDRLTELMKSKDIKIEQLIVVSKELASVQSQLDALSTQKANLRRRIDTELLTINMRLPQHVYASGESPVGDAFRAFGSTILGAFADVIRFIAVLLPWLLIIVPGVIALRLFWRWIRASELRRRLGP
jgi:hypothetical protein